mmetsp:Transcript_16417/g.49999  ORF Transcript_16417/g.49999 Transcript_16417/m.49999 type:complete len:293 (-) Transcript_16417:331-1209(-)
MEAEARSRTLWSRGDTSQDSLTGGSHFTLSGGSCALKCFNCEAATFLTRSRACMNIETIVIASTGVCSALSPPRPFSKQITVKDLSNQRLRPSIPFNAMFAASSFVFGDLSSSATQKSASSTIFSDAALVLEASNCVCSAAHSSRFRDVSSEMGGSSTSSRMFTASRFKTAAICAWSSPRLSGSPERLYKGIEYIAFFLSTTTCLESDACTRLSLPSAGTRVMPNTRVNWFMSSGLPRIFSMGNTPVSSIPLTSSRQCSVIAAACTLVVGMPRSGITPNQFMCTAMVVRVRK